MFFSVLGPLEVRDGGESLSLGGLRQRSVLALLLLDGGRAVAADRMVTEIWGDEPPGGARDSLYTYISNLRRVVGRDRIVRADGGYLFEPIEGDTVDAEDFDSYLAEARRLAGPDPGAALSLIDQSLSFWRGRPYEGMEDLPSIAPEAARIEELRLRALEDRIEAELRTGTAPDVGGVEMLTAEHPYRERFWALLAHALYRAGRQAEALRALARLRRQLADDLGIDPSPSISRLEERILLQDPTLEEGAAPPTNLPAPTSSFIGRVDDLSELESRLFKHRLITVLGPGGAGKTRLAIEVATRVAGGFPDGVWLVDLAQVAAPEGVGEAVAAALQLATSPSVDHSDALIARLRPRTTLLVLDNCEHVSEAAGQLAERLLAGAPDLKILATSRRSLGTTIEVLVSLEGLETAADGNFVGDAERLFEARAAAVQPGFELDDKNGRDVTAICRYLDGMPLALELAAGRSDALSPGEIRRHLHDRFQFLEDLQTDRSTHRSLQASLDWSYVLLSPDDRGRFDRLGVFEGPFLAASSATVLGAPSEIAAVDDLRRLISASLVQVVPGTITRYRMLETMRLYARTHLEETAGSDAIQNLHDRHYHYQCRDLRASIFGSGRPAARRTIEAELADYQATFDRFADGIELEAALEMAWPLGHLWLFSGRLREGSDRLEPLLDRSAGVTGRPRADALTAASFLVSYAQNYDRAIEWSDEAIDIYSTIDDQQGLAYVLARRGHFAFSVGDVPRALELLQHSLEICTRIGYEEGTAWPLTLLGQARLWSGDESDEVRDMLAEGRRRFIAIGDTYGQMHANMFLQNVDDPAVEHQLRYAEESIALSDQPGADPLIRPAALHNLAYTVWDAGELERAHGLNRMSTQAALDMGVTVSSGMAFFQAALFAGIAGEASRAATLYGAGDRYFVMQMAPFYDRRIQPGIAAATEALGSDRYQWHYEEGQAMSVEEASAFVMDG